jgi:Domain of unknown function (DUF4440)
VIHTETEELLRQQDTEIDGALTIGDGPALTRLLAEEYIHNHSHGLLRRKDDYIAHVTSRTNLPAREISVISVQLHDAMAVTTGNIDVRYPDGLVKHKRYVRVWRLTADNAWQLLSAHTFAAQDRDPENRHIDK